MPLFDRVHECSEYEQWSETNVQKVNEMRLTLSKKKRDPKSVQNEH